ncbi:hypothetical protein BDZ91DRAFT_715665 [Kalaharituber pfeilii]|nr:hypothetical protein BDZ91DRAFT_715665 [Kalaharituber pfeilii]
MRGVRSRTVTILATGSRRLRRIPFTAASTNGSSANLDTRLIQSERVTAFVILATLVYTISGFAASWCIIKLSFLSSSVLQKHMRVVDSTKE